MFRGYALSPYLARVVRALPVVAVAAFAGGGVAYADDPPAPAEPATPETERFAVHGQSTFVWQTHPGFPASYSGTNSLSPRAEDSRSWSLTLDVGANPWTGGEIHVNPEAALGVPFSGLHGTAGVPNGELQKGASPDPNVYLARIFLRQTFGLGGGTETQEADFNQLAGVADKRRVVITAGNFAVTDIFDSTKYAHDQRTQFLNWAFLTNGSFDYPADTRGYDWGLALEFVYDDWSFRAGRFLMPSQSNGQDLDTDFIRHYGDVFEVEHRHELEGQPGAVWLDVWHNRVRSGSFSDALAYATANGGAPDVANIRTEQDKYGVGITLEQQVAGFVGLFLRAGFSDDRTETYAFTEIGRDLSFGTVLDGAAWGRENDSFGLAYAVNFLGGSHRAYLAAGGAGAFLGDGALDYAPERILEAYYSVGVCKYFSVSPDFQFVMNPGYNAARGPAEVFGVRLHARF